VIDKYLRVSDVSLWVAVRQYVFSSRRYELAQSISAAEWGSLLERCQVTAGSSRGIRCLWYRCCWIPWTAHLPLLPRTARCSDPPTRPRIAIPLHRRMVAYKARRLVAWRKSCCCRCWSSWPRTPASWPRKAIPWPCRVLRPGPGGVQDPLEPPGRDNSGPSWPRKSRANRKQRSRSRVEPGVSLYTVYSARLSLVIFLFSILSSPTAQRSNVERYAGDNASIAFIRWDKINSVPAGRHSWLFSSLFRCRSEIYPLRSVCVYFSLSFWSFSALLITNRARTTKQSAVETVHEENWNSQTGFIDVRDENVKFQLRQPRNIAAQVWRRSRTKIDPYERKDHLSSDFHIDHSGSIEMLPAFLPVLIFMWLTVPLPWK